MHSYIYMIFHKKKQTKKMNKIKKQEYTTPIVKAVDFLVEKGFEISGEVLENIEEGQNISGDDTENSLVRWQ